jgi:hypothetical protein
MVEAVAVHSTHLGRAARQQLVQQSSVGIPLLAEQRVIVYVGQQSFILPSLPAAGPDCMQAAYWQQV